MVPEMKVQIQHKFEGEGPCKAVATVMIADAFIIHNVRIVEKDGRVFVAMPDRKRRVKGEDREQWVDIVHPVTSETRQALNTAAAKALEEYTPAE